MRKEQKMRLVATNDENAEEGFVLQLIPERFRYYIGDEEIVLGEVEVAYDAPNNLTVSEFRLRAIMTLQEKQKRIMADSQRQVTELQTKINALQLLTYRPIEPVEPEDGPPEEENISRFTPDIEEPPFVVDVPDDEVSF